MANTLNFEAGNGNWWRPCNYERKLLIGPEHTLHWIHWRISCSCVGKYGWKTVESKCNVVWFFDSVLWRELVVSLPKPHMVHLKSITTLLLLSPLQGVCGNHALLNVLSNYIELELFISKTEVGTQCEKAPNFKAVLVRWKGVTHLILRKSPAYDVTQKSVIPL